MNMHFKHTSHYWCSHRQTIMVSDRSSKEGIGFYESAGFNRSISETNASRVRSACFDKGHWGGLWWIVF